MSTGLVCTVYKSLPIRTETLVYDGVERKIIVLSVDVFLVLYRMHLYVMSLFVVVSFPSHNHDPQRLNNRLF